MPARVVKGLGLGLGALAVAASLSVPQWANALSPTPAPAPAPPPVVEPAPQPEGLKGVPVPEPSQLGTYVASKAAAIRLGKALFWDMQLGSDGRTACASCHFQAGADPRSINQVSPGLGRVNSAKAANPDYTFQVGGPNYQLKADDFPFHKFENPADRNSRVLRTSNDTSSSQGAFKLTFKGVNPGSTMDYLDIAGDPVFQTQGLQSRQVEPRNTPTVVNAIFNFRNFWDGRATYLFNGATQFGAMDTQARVYKNTGTLFSNVTAVQVRIDNASVASLATGPALSTLEMSAVGRSWPQIARRLLSATPLAQQEVSPSDSVLGAVRSAAGKGLNGNYESMVKAAFRSEWWNGSQQVNIAGTAYSQPEANFSLFFGLAVQLYTATLVADDSPFDRYMAGDARAMSTDAAVGMGLFFNKARCAECHGGAELTTASVRNTLRTPLSRMVMGNGQTAVYDEGFYNIAIGKTLEDIGNGGKNDPGRPMALTALAQQVSSAEFERLIGIAPNLAVSANERIAVNGAFKVPTVRNAELTAPYFHNGDSLTLEQVVEFYNRGGNHFNNNIADVDAEIQPLGLSATEMRQLVAFMKATTDDRVRFARAPFDHPQLIVTNGHATDAGGRVLTEFGIAKDAFVNVPAVGAAGLSTPPAPFLSFGRDTSAQSFALAALHSGKCLEVSPASSANGTPVVQNTCKSAGANDYQLWEEVAVAGGFGLVNKATGKCLDVSGVSLAAGATVYLWDCHGGANQTFNWHLGDKLMARHSEMCLDVTGAGTADGTPVIQWTCNANASHQSFAKR